MSLDGLRESEGNAPAYGPSPINGTMPLAINRKTSASYGLQKSFLELLN